MSVATTPLLGFLDVRTRGVVGRINTSADTAYFARHTTVGEQWQLFKVVAGSSTQLGTPLSATPTIDQVYRLTLRMIGSAISVLLDGVVIITATDTAITAAGMAGLRVSGTASNSAGLHLDNFFVRSIG